MLRSTIRRLRRTLSFKSKKKKKDGGGPATDSNQNWENDADNIKNGECNFPVKYLGSIEVSESRGTQVCSQAAHQMKMSAAGKKKQRVTLSVTEETIRVTDDQTKIMVLDQVIEKVSFCTPDPHDEKLFSYICRDGTSRRWLCHSFKGIKDSGERISHAVGCAFAACLAKKQAQNQQKESGLQRGTSSRKTLEARPNGVKLPQQSVDMLKMLNESNLGMPVEESLVQEEQKSAEVPQKPQSEVPSPPTTSKQVDTTFARPRPSVGLDAAAFTRHTSLPYRTKKSQTSTGSATYQALTEDPLPPRIFEEAAAPKPDIATFQPDFWLNNNTTAVTPQVNTVASSLNNYNAVPATNFNHTNGFDSSQHNPFTTSQVVNHHHNNGNMTSLTQPVAPPPGAYVGGGAAQFHTQQSANPFLGAAQMNANVGMSRPFQENFI